MRRNLRLLWTLCKMKLNHLMVFRLSFFGAFFVDGSLFIVQILLFEVLYGQVDTIGGWQKGEMMIFVGTFSLVNAIIMSTFFFGIIRIPEKIRTGTLDHYLTKPANPLLRLSFEEVNPGSLPLIAMSFVILGRGLSLLPVPPTFGQMAGYAILILLMSLLWYDLMLMLRTLPIFFLNASALYQMEESLFELSMKVPGVVFQGFWKVLFQGLLPYGLIATLPTQALTGTASLPALLWGCVVVLLFSGFALRFWKFGLSRYKSASS